MKCYKLARSDPQLAVDLITSNPAQAALGIGQVCATHNDRQLFTDLGAIPKLRSALAQAYAESDHLFTEQWAVEKLREVISSPPLPGYTTGHSEALPAMEHPAAATETIAALLFALYRLCTNHEHNAHAVEEDIPLILALLRRHVAAPNIQSCGLFLLSTLSTRSVCRHAEVLDLVCCAMEQYGTNRSKSSWCPDVVLAGCRVIALTSVGFEGIDARRALTAIGQSIRACDETHTPVFIELCMCLKTLVYDMSSRSLMESCGVWDAVRERMATMPLDACEVALSALQEYEKRQRQVDAVYADRKPSYAESVEDIPELLQRIAADLPEQVVLLARLGDVAITKDGRAACLKHKCLPLLCSIFSNGVEQGDGEVIVAVCGTLRLVLMNSTSAKRSKRIVAKLGPLLVTSLDIFLRDVLVMCALLEFARAIIPAFSFGDVPKILSQRILNTMTVYPCHPRVLADCMACLELLVLSCSSQPIRWGTRCVHAAFDHPDVKKHLVHLLGAIQLAHGTDTLLAVPGSIEALAEVSSRRAREVLVKCASDPAGRNAVCQVLERTTLARETL